jgi:hypothetical protein
MIPMNNATKELLVVEITVLAKSPPRYLIPIERPLIPTKNK